MKEKFNILLVISNITQNDILATHYKRLLTTSHINAIIPVSDDKQTVEQSLEASITKETVLTGKGSEYVHKTIQPGDSLDVKTVLQDDKFKTIVVTQIGSLKKPLLSQYLEATVVSKDAIYMYYKDESSLFVLLDYLYNLTFTRPQTKQPITDKDSILLVKPDPVKLDNTQAGIINNNAFGKLQTVNVRPILQTYEKIGYGISVNDYKKKTMHVKMTNATGINQLDLTASATAPTHCNIIVFTSENVMDVGGALAMSNRSFAIEINTANHELIAKLLIEGPLVLKRGIFKQISNAFFGTDSNRITRKTYQQQKSAFARNRKALLQTAKQNTGFVPKGNAMANAIHQNYITELKAGLYGLDTNTLANDIKQSRDELTKNDPLRKKLTPAEIRKLPRELLRGLDSLSKHADKLTAEFTTDSEKYLNELAAKIAAAEQELDTLRKQATPESADELKEREEKLKADMRALYLKGEHRLVQQIIESLIKSGKEVIQTVDAIPFPSTGKKDNNNSATAIKERILADYNRTIEGLRTAVDGLLHVATEAPGVINNNVTASATSGIAALNKSIGDITADMTQSGEMIRKNTDLIKQANTEIRKLENKTFISHKQREEIKQKDAGIEALQTMNLLHIHKRNIYRSILEYYNKLLSGITISLNTLSAIKTQAAQVDSTVATRLQTELDETSALLNTALANLARQAELSANKAKQGNRFSKMAHAIASGNDTAILENTSSARKLASRKRRISQLKGITSNPEMRLLGKAANLDNLDRSIARRKAEKQKMENSLKRSKFYQIGKRITLKKRIKRASQNLADKEAAKTARLARD